MPFHQTLYRSGLYITYTIPQCLKLGIFCNFLGLVLVFSMSANKPEPALNDACNATASDACKATDRGKGTPSLSAAEGVDNGTPKTSAVAAWAALISTQSQHPSLGLCGGQAAIWHDPATGGLSLCHGSGRSKQLCRLEVVKPPVPSLGPPIALLTALVPHVLNVDSRLLLEGQSAALRSGSEIKIRLSALPGFSSPSPPGYRAGGSSSTGGTVCFLFNPLNLAAYEEVGGAAGAASVEPPSAVAGTAGADATSRLRRLEAQAAAIRAALVRSARQLAAEAQAEAGAAGSDAAASLPYSHVKPSRHGPGDPRLAAGALPSPHAEAAVADTAPLSDAPAWPSHPHRHSLSQPGNSGFAGGAAAGANAPLGQLGGSLGRLLSALTAATAPKQHPQPPPTTHPQLPPRLQQPQQQLPGPRLHGRGGQAGREQPTAADAAAVGANATGPAGSMWSQLSGLCELLSAAAPPPPPPPVNAAAAAGEGAPELQPLKMLREVLDEVLLLGRGGEPSAAGGAAAEGPSGGTSTAGNGGTRPLEEAAWCELRPEWLHAAAGPSGSTAAGAAAAAAPVAARPAREASRSSGLDHVRGNLHKLQSMMAEFEAELATGLASSVAEVDEGRVNRQDAPVPAPPPPPPQPSALASSWTSGEQGSLPRRLVPGAFSSPPPRPRQVAPASSAAWQLPSLWSQLGKAHLPQREQQQQQRSESAAAAEPSQQGVYGKPLGDFAALEALIRGVLQTPDAAEAIEAAFGMAEAAAEVAKRKAELAKTKAELAEAKAVAAAAAAAATAEAATAAAEAGKAGLELLAAAPVPGKAGVADPLVGGGVSAAVGEAGEGGSAAMAFEFDTAAAGEAVAAASLQDGSPVMEGEGDGMEVDADKVVSEAALLTGPEEPSGGGSGGGSATAGAAAAGAAAASAPAAAVAGHGTSSLPALAPPGLSEAATDTVVTTGAGVGAAAGSDPEGAVAPTPLRAGPPREPLQQKEQKQADSPPVAAVADPVPSPTAAAAAPAAAATPIAPPAAAPLQSELVAKRVAAFRSELSSPHALTPPEALPVDLDSLPYYLGQGTKERLLATARLHLHHSRLASFTSDLPCMSPRVLLVGPYGSELYQQALVSALAASCGAQLLVLDRAALGLLEGA
ncbi:hypothetical protein Agub_g7075, partial [Astrephomene gubernaculifera]